MRTKIAAGALGTVLWVGVAAPAHATDGDDAPVDNPITEDTNSDDGGGFDDWGLLGLLGLLGLGGLAGKKRRDDVVTTRATGSTTNR